jgi:hypothetical protein
VSTNYEAFYPEITPFFAGIPEIVITNAIRNACIEFCDRSDWLLYTPIKQDIIANQAVYDLTLDVPTDTTVARVQSAWIYDLPLIPKTEDELRQIYNFDWRQQVGRPMYYTQYDPNNITLVPIPTVATSQTLALLLVLRPTRASTTVDDTIYERWLDVIAAGAKSRLYEIPGVQSENLQLAGSYKAIFNAGVDKAIAERTRGLTRRAMRVRPPKLV